MGGGRGEGGGLGAYLGVVEVVMDYLGVVFWEGDLAGESFFPAVLEGGFEELAATREDAWVGEESFLVTGLANFELDDFCEALGGC